MPNKADLEQALSIARGGLSGANFERQAGRSGCGFEARDAEGGILTVPFFAREYSIALPAGDVTYADQPEQEVPLWERIFLLHYVIKADGSKPAGEYLTFPEIPDALLYREPFKRRAIDPLEKTFGWKPGLLIKCAAEIEGVTVSDIGDEAVCIHVLPKVPVTLVLWLGDEELPPKGNVLLDKSVTSYLPTEDIALISQMTVIRLIIEAGKLKAAGESSK